MDNLVERYATAKEELLDRFRVIVKLIEEVYPCEFHDTQFTDNEFEIYTWGDYVTFSASSPAAYEDWDYTGSLDVPLRFFSAGAADGEVVEYYRNLALEQERKRHKENLVHVLQTARQCGVTDLHELLAKAVGATTYKEIEEVVEQYLEDEHKERIEELEEGL